MNFSLGLYLGFAVLRPFHDGINLSGLVNCSGWIQYSHIADTGTNTIGKNHNEEDNPVGFSNDAAEPVPFANLPPASVDDVKLAILEENFEITVTDNYTHYHGMNVL